jgi:hypothetical protein
MLNADNNDISCWQTYLADLLDKPSGQNTLYALMAKPTFTKHALCSDDKPTQLNKPVEGDSFIERSLNIHY